MTQHAVEHADALDWPGAAVRARRSPPALPARWDREEVLPAAPYSPEYRRLIDVREYPQPAAPGEVVSSLQLAALPSAAFWARRHTEAALRAWRLEPEDIETAQLLVSELVTNSVKFTGPSSAEAAYCELVNVKAISLILRYCTGRLIIEVCDPDPTPPVLTEVGHDAESGRGLMLVQALSKEWNYYLPSTGGKTVYCVISSGRRPSNGPYD